MLLAPTYPDWPTTICWRASILANSSVDACCLVGRELDRNPTVSVGIWASFGGGGVNRLSSGKACTAALSSYRIAFKCMDKVRIVMKLKLSQHCDTE